MKFRSFYRIFFFIGAKNKSTPLKAMICIASLLVAAISQTANAQAVIENIPQLRQKVAQFLTTEYQASNAAKVEIKVGSLDARLRLAQCEQTLVLNLLDTTGNGGNINVQVICNGAQRWTVLVPAQAIVFRPVAVAGRNLQRGDVVGANDIEMNERDVSQYRQGFNILPDDIVGKEIKYAVAKGEAFRTSALTSALVIKRGDEVSMEAMAGSIRVVTQGTAASDGRIGQQIRVKNNRSERIINARVVGPGKVQTVM